MQAEPHRRWRKLSTGVYNGVHKSNTCPRFCGMWKGSTRSWGRSRFETRPRRGIELRVCKLSTPGDNVCGQGVVRRRRPVPLSARPWGSRAGRWGVGRQGNTLVNASLGRAASVQGAVRRGVWFDGGRPVTSGATRPWVVHNYPQVSTGRLRNFQILHHLCEKFSTGGDGSGRMRAAGRLSEWPGVVDRLSFGDRLTHDTPDIAGSMVADQLEVAVRRRVRGQREVTFV